MNRFEKQFAFSTMVIYEGLELHKKLWNDMCENDGYLKPDLKAKLTRSINLIKDAYSKYKDMKFYEKEFNRFRDDIYNFCQIENSKKKFEKSFDFSRECKLLPPHLLDSFVSAATAFEYCTDKLDKTLKRLGYYETFVKMSKPLQGYCDFVTRELVMNTGGENGKVHK